MRTTTKVQISTEAERLLDKIAKKGGYNSRSTVLEVIIREAAHARNLTLEYEEEDFSVTSEQLSAAGSSQVENLRASLASSLRLRIADINVQSNPRGRHLHQLQSGSDAFSRLKLPELVALAEPEAVSEIEAAFPNSPPDQEATLRWVLRGLSLHHSIGKRLYYLKKLKSPVQYQKSSQLDVKALQLAISAELREQIESLNLQAQPKDSDLTNLRVGGTDAVSRLSAEEVVAYASEDAKAQAQAAFPENTPHQIEALRWVLRGLSPRFAIRKTKVQLYKFAQ